MTVYLALIKREFLEHRGAFLYAPLVLTSVIFLALLLATTFGTNEFMHSELDIDLDMETSLFVREILSVVIVASLAAWSAYLFIALVFYFADSFSADRRNNSLLFWKSMPQSDLKILSSKALTALTAFPLAIMGFAFISGILAYVVLGIHSLRMPSLLLPNIFEATGLWVQYEFVGAFYILLSILWYAPFLAWVAGLSTLFQRWSIPLAFLIPGVLLLVERITSIGHLNGTRPIANFLSHRLEGIAENINVIKMIVHNPDFVPLSLIGQILTEVRWFDMVIGLAFATLLVFLASEYRRRRIAA